jgi:hypothetical protein
MLSLRTRGSAFKYLDNVRGLNDLTEIVQLPLTLAVRQLGDNGS